MRTESGTERIESGTERTESSTDKKSGRNSIKARTAALVPVLMMLIALVAQGISLYKARYTAVNFGAGSQMDAFYLDMNMASFLFTFFSGGITTLLLPAYLRREKPRSLDSFIALSLGSGFLAAVLLSVFRYPLIGLLSDRGTAYTAMAAEYLPFCLLMQGGGSLMAITAAYYQSRNIFILPRILSLLCNAGLAAVLWLYPGLEFKAYFTWLLGWTLLNLLCNVGFCVGAGFRFRPEASLRDPELLGMLRLLLPTLVSTGVFKLQNMIDTGLANKLPEGSLSILSYSLSVISLINTICLGNLITYLYPKMILRMQQGLADTYLWRSCGGLHALVCAMFLGYCLCGREGLSLLFAGGVMGESELTGIWLCTGIYLFGQQGNIVRDMVYRYFYARGNTAAASRNGIMVSCLNVVFSLALTPFVGIYGIVLGTVLSGMVSLAMIVRQYKRRYGAEVCLRPPVLICAGNLGAMLLCLAASLYVRALAEKLIAVKGSALEQGTASAGSLAGLLLGFGIGMTGALLFLGLHLLTARLIWRLNAVGSAVPLQ